MNKINHVVVLCGSLFLAGCDKDTSAPVDSVRAVSIVTVTDSLLQGERSFPARINAGDSTPLAFKRPGQLQTLSVREGEHVKKGQVIAELDNQDARLRLKDRQAAFELAQTQYQRFATLSTRQVIPRAELDTQRAARDSAQAALQLAREEVNDMQLRAPFSGVIATVLVRNHQTLQSGMTVAVLDPLDLLDVVFSLPENLFAVLNINNRDYQPRVVLNNLPGREFTARYKEHTTHTTTGALTYQVTLSLPRPPDLPLLSGMSGSVRVHLGTLDGRTPPPRIIVPVEAVFNPDDAPRDQPHVWVIEEHEGKLSVESRRVETGDLVAEGIQIVSGLVSGERIVATGTRELHPHQEVRAWVRERGL